MLILGIKNGDLSVKHVVIFVKMIDNPHQHFSDLGVVLPWPNPELPIGEGFHRPPQSEWRTYMMLNGDVQPL